MSSQITIASLSLGITGDDRYICTSVSLMVSIVEDDFCFIFLWVNNTSAEAAVSLLNIDVSPIYHS